MHALKKVIGVITFAALSLSGSAVWAQSFKAKAELDSFNLVPPFLSTGNGTITLTFKKPKPNLQQQLEQASPARVRPNPGVISTQPAGDLQDIVLENIRLYFGQSFSNGHPIATLCDNCLGPLRDKRDCPATDDIDGLECPKFDPDDPDPMGIVNFALSDFQFERFQLQRIPDESDSQVDLNRRVPDDKDGLRLIKDLIKRGLIYVVVNSKFKAKVGKDEFGNTITTIVGYKPPKCSILPSFYCKAPNGKIIVDGDIRGTLRLD